jgi:hypothetical protein
MKEIMVVETVNWRNIVITNWKKKLRFMTESSRSDLVLWSSSILTILIAWGMIPWLKARVMSEARCYWSMLSK